MTGPEGSSEFCFPRISMFPDVARSWHLTGNSFIVRCHVTMNEPMNGRAVAGKTPAI